MECEKMGPKFVFVIGFCGLLAGTVSTFLLQPSSTLDSSEEWGQWSVLQTKPTCVLFRRRNCTSDGCRNGEVKYCNEVAHWSEWGPLQCTTQGGICFIAKTRTCSVEILKNCGSNETYQHITVWGDMKTCPCRKDGTVVSNTGNGHWNSWTTWRCQIHVDHCYIYRTRQCSVPDTINCPPMESSQVKLWTDQCPCQKDSITSSLGLETASTLLSIGSTTTPSVSAMKSSQTTISTDQSVSLVTTAPSWQEWTEWECHNVDIGCMMHRHRQCSTIENRCLGEHYQVAACKDSTCNRNASNATTTSTPVTQVMWNPWGSWECHTEQIPCVLYRYRDCSNNVEDDCMVQGGRGYEIGPCDERCYNATTITPLSSTYASMVTSEMPIMHPAMLTTPTSVSRSTTSNIDIITSFLSSTIGPTKPTEYVPIYWLEWSNWECKQELGLCFMAHTRNCSTFDVQDCERELDGDHYGVVICNSTICPATWLEWEKWRCKMDNHGICNMTRTRECSTGSAKDCGSKSIMTKSCDQNVCPDAVKLQQSGQCRYYVSEDKTCSDEISSCNVVTNKFHPICSYGDFASKNCPRSCGCCEEEPHWLEWSTWECYLVTNRTCEMRRTRHCSSANACKGMSVIVTKCSDKICPGVQSTTTTRTKQTGTPTSAASATSANYYTATINRMSSNNKTSYNINGRSTIGISTSPHNTVPPTATWPANYGANNSTYIPTLDNTDTVTVVNGGTSTVPTALSNTTAEISSSTYSHKTLSIASELFTKKATSQTKTTVRYNNTNITSKPSTDEGKDSSTNNQLFQHTTGVEAKYSTDIVGSTMPTNTFITNTGAATPVRIHTQPYTIPPLSEWSHWLYDACSVTCGNGTAMRLRRCSSGKDSDCGNGSAIETVTCSDGPCPVNGAWSDWQDWSKCSTSCAAGIRSRYRTCSNPPPAFGGKNCIGNSSMTENCDNGRCPEWSHWFHDACSVTCGTGTTMRLRHCSSGKDSDCGTGKAIEPVKCTEKPCTSI